MRVGRAPIDEEAIRQIEDHNPDVEFDWSRILKGGTGPAEAEARPAARPQRVERRERRGPKRLASPDPPRAAAIPEPEPPPEAADTEDAAMAAQHFEMPADDAPPAALPDDVTRPVYQRLGAEGLARLRARYAEVMARISERQLDDAAREELKASAERLNPDGWVTSDEVASGLEQYESVYESLRAVVGQPRRRRRRR